MTNPLKDTEATIQLPPRRDLFPSDPDIEARMEIAKKALDASGKGLLSGKVKAS